MGLTERPNLSTKLDDLRLESGGPKKSEASLFVFLFFLFSAPKLNGTLRQ